MFVYEVEFDLYLVHCDLAADKSLSGMDDRELENTIDAAPVWLPLICQKSLGLQTSTAINK